MVFLYKIWIFNMDFTTLVSFIFGILIGMVMLCLIYAILVVLSLRDKKYQVKVQANDLKAVEAEEMIHIAQKSFLDKDLRGDLTKIQFFKEISTDLVYGIASRFYPDSKRPLMELTIDECVELIGYIQIRLNEILDNRILKIVKRFKVADIVNLTKATTSVVDSKAFEVTKTVSKAFSIGRKIINSINIFWWGKKFVTDVGIEIIMRKLYVVTLGIIGEEAYKIYSKSYKNQAEDIDAKIGELVESIDTDLQDKLKEEKGEALPTTSKKNLEKVTYEKMLKKRVKVLDVSNPVAHKSIYDHTRPLKEKKEIPMDIVPFDALPLAIRED